MFAATPYDGPDERVEIPLAGRTLRVWRPADPDRLLDDPDVLALNRRDDYMPYWAYLWPGAFLLAEAVLRRQAPPPDAGAALEIGCGLGLAGLAALARGHRVHFTDHDATPLRYVARSVEANGFDAARATTGLLDWRDLPEERYGLILGADVLYERRLVPLVANLIRTMLEPGGAALVAGPYRSAGDDLPAALARHGLVTVDTPIEAAGPDGRVHRGTLHQIRPCGR
jgi:predicted nicotinamide N-methyase